MPANLELKATFDSMQRLGDLPATPRFTENTESVERPGHEPTTPAASFAGRNGYEAGFLEGWDIPLPMPTDTRVLCPLRRGGDGFELKYQNFSVLMSAERRMALLTATNINGDQSKRLPRIDTWSYDGRMNPDDQWGDELYYHNDLNRGHVVRREDPVWGSFASWANIDTFHFTNSCPQMAALNQRTWLGLEDYVLKHARTEKMHISVFTGPFFTNDDREYRGAKIPLSFWKVVAIVTEEGRPSATAYEVKQEKELEALEFVYGGFKTYQISITSVMERSEIDFGTLIDYDGFSQSGPSRNERLESSLDARI